MTVRPQSPTASSERFPSAFFSVTLQVGHTSTLVLFWPLFVLSTLVPFAQYVSRDLQHSALYPGNSPRTPRGKVDAIQLSDAESLS